ncbi:MAG: LiaF-related protein [Pedobacter sp.]|nr:LiaF-related protein [Pedobacter sp.]MDQ8052375.1 LiaF-related protein [Pedobacter sp.]
MENYNMENNNGISRSSKVLAGLFIIAIGIALTIVNFVDIRTNWIFTWSTFLMCMGLFVGIKTNFKNSGWLIMFLIGAYFTAQKLFLFEFDFHRVTLPLFLVGLGIFLILKPKSDFRRHDRWARRRQRWNNKFGQQNPYTGFEGPEPQPAPTSEQKGSNANDYLDSVNVFGGSHQTVYSKNFRGGEVVAVFGGCDLNLSQADFEGTIEIDITAIFGGCKIIVPPGWQVKSEVTAIFGGLDDKRSVQPIEGPTKLLVVRGIAMFGGVDIRNY